MIDNYHTKEVASSESCRGNLNPPKDLKMMKCRISQTSKASAQLFSPRDPWSFLFVCLESPEVIHPWNTTGKNRVPGYLGASNYSIVAKCMNTSNVAVNEIHVYTCRKTHVSINFIIHSALYWYICINVHLQLLQQALNAIPWVHSHWHQTLKYWKAMTPCMF